MRGQIGSLMLMSSTHLNDEHSQQSDFIARPRLRQMRVAGSGSSKSRSVEIGFARAFATQQQDSTGSPGRGLKTIGRAGCRCGRRKKQIALSLLRGRGHMSRERPPAVCVCIPSTTPSVFPPPFKRFLLFDRRGRLHIPDPCRASFFRNSLCSSAPPGLISPVRRGAGHEVVLGTMRAASRKY